MATVFGFGMNVQASSNRDPIREILGVDYTISDTEFTKPMWGHYEGEIVRWQMVETQQQLNLRRFNRNDNFPYAPFGGLWATKTGDVKIVTHHSGQQWLLIDIGSHPDADYDWIRAYHAVRVNVKLSPTETIAYRITTSIHCLMCTEMDISCLCCHLCEELGVPCLQCRTVEDDIRDFGMYLQYEGKYLKYYSTDAVSYFIPAMIEALEYYMPILIDLMGVVPTRHITISYYEHDHWLEAYPWSGLGFAHGRQGGIVLPHRPNEFAENIPVPYIATFLHEITHAIQETYLLDPNMQVWHAWLHEGTANHIPWIILNYNDLHHTEHIMIEHIQNNTIPTLDYINRRFRDGINTDAENPITDWYQIKFTWFIPTVLMQFVHDNWGLEYIIKMNRCHASWAATLGTTEVEFENQFHRWLRIVYTPDRFHPDPALIGTWDRLGTQQSLNSFTERNQRNVNNWAQDILRQRGNRHQQLTFNNNGRITATSVTGFGNTWTDGFINGRGYEIRTIGSVDYLFINNRGSAAPSTGTGAPWTVFIRN